MKIQMDIPKELNQKLKVFKALNNNSNLQETIIKILERDLKDIIINK